MTEEKWKLRFVTARLHAKRYHVYHVAAQRFLLSFGEKTVYIYHTSRCSVLNLSLVVLSSIYNLCGIKS